MHDRWPLSLRAIRPPDFEQAVQPVCRTQSEASNESDQGLLQIVLTCSFPLTTEQADLPKLQGLQDLRFEDYGRL
jgi:hypothetical protein